uniref:RNA-directed RNA polymerase n=1 Tax=Bovine group B rotavirus TaxID=35334 RepID=D3VZT8_9REOV|nr:VP1 [Bovine group B rotavirus]
MDTSEFFDWLSKEFERNLTYIKSIYTNPKIAKIVFRETDKLWESKTLNSQSPDDILKEINELRGTALNIDEKLEKLLRLRYLTVYVDDKSDKREIVSMLIKKALDVTNTKETFNSIEPIEFQAKQWKIKNSSSLKPYHHNIPICEYIRDNEIEYIDTGDNKWQSDTLQGLMPNYYHRTHTLVGAITLSVLKRLQTYSIEQKTALHYLFNTINQSYSEGYLELSLDRKWSHTIEQLRKSTFRLYNTKVIHAACAMVSLIHASSIIPEFLCQIIAVYKIIPANAAKLLSSPMTLYIGVATFPSKMVASTGNASECAPTNISNNTYVADEQIEEWNTAFKDDPLNESVLLKEMNKNLKTNVNTFVKIFNCFSATFHVGHRIDNAQDAIIDQVTAPYTTDVDREMYDIYYYKLKSMLKTEVKKYVEDHIHRDYQDVTAESLSALANSSNGFQKEVLFIDRKIKTTKKILHLDADLLSGDFRDIRKIMSRGIPMGTRNVPARQTRGIFILPWQVAAVQHTIAESLYKTAKKGAYQGSFAEAYTSKTASLTYGVLAEDTSKAMKIILYTDVSQWDASQHNTQPYRSAWINAIKYLREEGRWLKENEPRMLGINVLDAMSSIQESLLNSTLIVTSTRSNRNALTIRYHGVASGEKTTKVGNSFANVALIETVLDVTKQQIPDIEITHLRVDGDDNVVSMNTSCNISKLQSVIKSNYQKLNARVKALASYTGLEMAKRFIICGNIFERGAIPIFTAERPYGTDVSIQSMTGSSIYSSAVNAYRAFGDEYLDFMMDVLVPPSSTVRLTGRLRVLLSPITLFATGPLSFEVTQNGLGGRCRLYTKNIKLMQLFKMLTDTVSVAVTPEEVRLYSKTDQFNERVSVMIDSLNAKLKTSAPALAAVLREKEEQKTLGVPNVQTQKNRKQVNEALKILSIPEREDLAPKGYYPEELYALIVTHSDITYKEFPTTHSIYHTNNAAVTLLHNQLGVTISESKPIAKPVNHLYDIISALSPISISPSDILKQSRKYELTSYAGKKKFLSDLGLTGNTLKTYLASKMLFRDLLLAKYDKLYNTPGFGATQLTTIPLNIHSAEQVFSINVKLPPHLYEITMLMLLFEYVHYVFTTKKTYTATLSPMSQEQSVKLSSMILKMLDNIKLDVVSFTDDAW